MVRANKALRQASYRALERMARLEVAGSALAFAERAIRNGGYGRVNEKVDQAITVLHSALHEKRYRAVHDALVVGALVMDDDMRRAIAKATLEWYGKDHHVIMHLLDPDGESPGTWTADAEQQLRVEIRSGLGNLLGWDNLPEEWRPTPAEDADDDGPPHLDETSWSELGDAERADVYAWFAGRRTGHVDVDPPVERPRPARDDDPPHPQDDDDVFDPPGPA